MKIAVYISRIIIGIVFMFSGIVKAIDPLGTTYKFQDYFSAFNMSFLKDLSLMFAIILFTSEFLAGVSVLFRLRVRTGAWVVIIMMAIFTPLTLILALTNPVSDCGCFGDAIHLTNWQTFWKNVILLVPALVIFIKRKEIETSGNKVREWAVIAVIMLFVLLFASYNLRYLPVIDFLPYTKGIYIPDKMVIPEGKPTDRYETTFIYEKDGIKKEFTLNNYPSDDTTWKFIDQKSILVSKGYQPPIHDFFISAPDNTDITDQILSSKNYIILMISKKLSEADPQKLQKGYELGDFCLKNNIGFYIVTASGIDEINTYRNDHIICQGDETTLKTMLRTNPGYMLLKEGIIIDKWSWANLPEENELIELLNK
jgi:uncharacterized membrane protein YphA (DoxX/SURF4 family)